MRLARNLTEYDPWLINLRPPQIGDIGYVIDFLPLDEHESPKAYIVEMSNPADGTDIWLSEFTEEEIEPLF